MVLSTKPLQSSCDGFQGPYCGLTPQRAPSVVALMVCGQKGCFSCVSREEDVGQLRLISVCPAPGTAPGTWGALSQGGLDECPSYANLATSSLAWKRRVRLKDANRGP